VRRFFSHPPGRRGNSGLTLIEMIGVLAIIAIVAAIVAPNAVRQIQTATAVGEDAKLDEIANALKAGIEATGLIPNPNLFPTNQDNPGFTTLQRGFGWAFLASNYTKQAGDKLLASFPGYTNLETYRRMFLSTNLAAAALTTDRTTLIANISTNITNWGGTIYPTNAKIFLVSSSLPDLRFTSLSGTNAGDFGCDTNGTPNLQVSGTFWNRGVVANLESWVKTFVNGVCYTPTNVVQAAWTNKGEFIHIKTVDLSEFFNKAREAQEKAIAQEDKNLEEIARALVAAIQATGELPNPNVAPFAAGGWAELARTYTSLADDVSSLNGRGTLHYAFPAEANGAQTSRRVYLDPLLMLYLAANGGFTTPNTGWNSATDSNANGIPDMDEGALRMYIVSSSKSDLFLAAPANNAGVQTAGAGYDDGGLLTALANWQKARTPPGDPMPGVIPVPNVIAQWGAAYPPLANYSTRGEFLHVKVVDLRPLFCRVQLTDTAAPEAVAGFSIAVAGGEYPPNSAVAVNVGNNRLTFASDADGALPFDQVASFNQVAEYNARHLVIPPAIIPPGSAEYAGPISPPSPTYDLISGVGPGLGDFLPSPDPDPPLGIPADHNQTQTFYVLKGRSINLFNGANGLDKSVVIQTDARFKYFNSTWTKVD